MPRASSKSAALRRGRGRRVPDYMLARMAKYYNIHGWQKTLEKYHISSSTMQKVARSNGVHKGSPTERTGKQLYLLAKKLEAALIEHRRAGNPPSDVESYAFFLLREILK